MQEGDEVLVRGIVVVAYERNGKPVVTVELTNSGGEKWNANFDQENVVSPD